MEKKNRCIIYNVLVQCEKKSTYEAHLSAFHGLLSYIYHRIDMYHVFNNEVHFVFTNQWLPIYPKKWFGIRPITENLLNSKYTDTPLLLVSLRPMNDWKGHLAKLLG